VSVGHRHQATDLHHRQFDDLLSLPWFAHCLARVERDIKIISGVDMHYVAGSDSELESVFIDRRAYSRILAARLLPSLIRHEVKAGRAVWWCPPMYLSAERKPAPRSVTAAITLRRSRVERAKRSNRVTTSMTRDCPTDDKSSNDR
jgi:hypothetical protein